MDVGCSTSPPKKALESKYKSLRGVGAASKEEQTRLANGSLADTCLCHSSRDLPANLTLQKDSFQRRNFGEKLC